MPTRALIYEYNTTTSAYELTATITGSNIISCNVVREYDPTGLTLPVNRGEIIISNTYTVGSDTKIHIQHSFDNGSTWAEDFAFIVINSNQTADNYTKIEFVDINSIYYGEWRHYATGSQTLSNVALQDYLEELTYMGLVNLTYDTGIASRTLSTTYKITDGSVRELTKYGLLATGCGIIQINNNEYLVTNKRPSSTYTTISSSNILIGAEYKSTESVGIITAYYRSSTGTYITDVAYNSSGATSRMISEYLLKSTHSIAEYLIADLNHKQMEATIYDLEQHLGDTIQVPSETGNHIGMIIKEETSYGQNKLTKVKLMLNETYGTVTYPSESSSSSGGGAVSS